ncbi:MAG: hypothetical protein IPI67_23435 [Myxococcales bacterium]|nr:hypothetical protein [Myxococcales bacterium]
MATRFCSAVFPVALIAASLLATAARAAPLQVRLANCEPVVTGSLGAGFTGDGVGNLPSTRKMVVRFAYVLANPNDNKLAAISDTDRVEVCAISAGGVRVCPGTGDWVIYDKASGTGAITEPDVFKSVAEATGRTEALLAIDFDDPLTKDWFFTVHLPQEAKDAFGDASTNGFCPMWSRLSPTSGPPTPISVYGAAPTAKPVRSARRLRRWFEGALEPAGPAGRREHLHAALRARVDTGGPAGGRRRAEQPNPGRCHRSKRAIPRLVQRRSSRRASAVPRLRRTPPRRHETRIPGGAFFGQVNSAQAVNVLAPPSQQALAAMSGVQLYTHEYFHSLAMAWSREHPGVNAHLGVLSEQLAASNELNLCLQGFPGATLLPSGDNRGQCVSAGKFGVDHGAGPYLGIHLLDFPSVNAVTEPYVSAFFLRYLQEQFAYPTPQAPHPSGATSQFPRVAGANLLPLSQRPISDEGVDLIGRLLQDFATKPGSTTAVLNNSLLQHLGRKLDDVVLDFHTAMVLKDYNDSDAVDADDRWRFDWTQLGGYYSTARLADGKPFLPRASLIEETCNPTATICDGLRRVTRQHDSFRVVGGVAVPDVLPVGSSVSSPLPVGIGKHGAAYFSVGVDNAWAGKLLKVSATVLSGDPQPAFRVFRIDEPSPGKRVAVPLCKAGIGEACFPQTSYTGAATVDVPVAIPRVRDDARSHRSG